MSMHREYKGFEIHAHALPSGNLHVPFVTLTKHTAKGVNEIKLEPPCGKGCKTEDEALKMAMEYGLAAIDGEVRGFDPRTLL